MIRRAHRPLFHIALLLLPAAVACTGGGTGADVRRLSARVDSLAITVAAMSAALQSGAAGAEGADTITVGAAGAASLGAASAPVTVVEFTDYQCPFCAQHARTTFGAIRAEFVDSGAVRYVVRDLPLPMHPFAEAAARAARCAGEQGAERYWRYHEALFEAQPQLAESTFASIAARVGLERSRFDACRNSSGVTAAVRQDGEEAAKAGLTGTPSFVVGRAVNGRVTGVVIRGAYPLERFRQAIKGALHQTPGVASAAGRTSTAGGNP
jgi:protein-disulfide isomerase